MRGSGRVGSGDKRLQAPAAALPSGGESERCPRCGSHNTKFCYYNNYNLAQPRHFCKACRRYWTLGGTLRNVPIGGSTRRATQNKQQASGSVSTASSSTRRRPAPAPASASASVSPSSSTSSSPPMTSLAFDAASVPPLQPTCKAEPLTAAESGSMDAVRSFESLLTEPLPAGFLALGEPFLGGREGFGLGLGLRDGPAEIIDEIGFGIERAAPAWPFFSDDDAHVAAGGSNTATGGIVGMDGEREAWQVVANGAGMVGDDGGDCFGWPELAMWTTPGKGLQ